MHPQEDDDFCRFESHQDLEGHQLSWFFSKSSLCVSCVTDGFLVALSAVWLGGTDTGSNLGGDSKFGWYLYTIMGIRKEPPKLYDKNIELAELSPAIFSETMFLIGSLKLIHSQVDVEKFAVSFIYDNSSTWHPRQTR